MIFTITVFGRNLPIRFKYLISWNVDFMLVQRYESRPTSAYTFCACTTRGGQFSRVTRRDLPTKFVLLRPSCGGPSLADCDAQKA